MIKYAVDKYSDMGTTRRLKTEHRFKVLITTMRFEINKTTIRIMHYKQWWLQLLFL
jgi:hypothetical protein